jgi:hypothetical protein
MDRNKYLYGLANPVSNTDPAGLYSLAELSANLAVRGYLSSSSYVKLAIAGGKLISRAHALARYVSIANSAFRLAFFVGSFFDKGAKGIESDISHEFQFTPDSSITIIASIRPPKGTLSFKPTYKSVSGEYAFTYDFERGKFDNNQGALSVKYDRLRDSIGLGTAKFDIESLSVVLEGEADSFSAGLEFEFLQAFSIGVGVDFEFPRDISTFVTLRGTKIVTVHC